ncbi:hypothetical protein [Actinoplanes sp. NPDC049265]|uniref:hypothetical protein n=1 Tax=Actinoplanes sp. NPDC049265 TaxID=3363902 RepID=UPI003722AFC5
MKTWVRKTLSVGVLAAGALLFTSANAAHADSKVQQDTSQNYGIGNGIQGAVPVNLGANACGNSVAALGWAGAEAACSNVFESGSYKQKSTKNVGALNGLQVLVPINGGINATGNAVSAAGAAHAAGASSNSFGGNKGKKESAELETKKGNGDPTQVSYDNYGLANGIQAYAPINLGANVCGNSISALGWAGSEAACWNFFGAKGNKGKQESGKVDQVTYDNYGVLNGLQLALPVNVLGNVTGNAISVGGSSHAAGASGNEVESGKGGGNDGVVQDSHGNVGALNGAQIAAPVNLGLNLCGNALSVLGSANAAANCGNDFGGNGGNGGHNGGNNGGGHGNGGDHGDNDGDHGDDDGDYAGDNGTDDHGNNGGDNGDDSDYGDSDRKVTKSATEGTAVDGVTKGLSTNNADVAGLSGVTGGLLKTLG